MVLALFDTFINSLINHGRGSGYTTKSRRGDEQQQQKQENIVDASATAAIEEPEERCDHDIQLTPVDDSDSSSDQESGDTETGAGVHSEGSFSSCSYLNENFQSVLDASSSLLELANRTSVESAETETSFESLASQEFNSRSMLSNAQCHQCGEEAAGSAGIALHPIHQMLILKICDMLSTSAKRPSAQSSFVVDLSSDQAFWRYLLDELGLHSFLASLDCSELSEEWAAFELESSAFFAKFKKLVSCLNAVDAETDRMLADSPKPRDYKFDRRFLLNLAFVTYEYCLMLSNFVAVYFFDHGDSLFEHVCLLVLAKYVLPHLSTVISKPREQTPLGPTESYDLNNNKTHVSKTASSAAEIGNGRQLLDEIRRTLEEVQNDENESLKFLQQFKQHVEEHVVQPWSETESQPFDIWRHLSPPACPDERNICNPLTRSYKCLLTNLNHLRTITHNPFSSSMVQDAFESGRVGANMAMFACMSISYYTMGYFDVGKVFFESLYQHIYDRRCVHEEYYRIFRCKSSPSSLASPYYHGSGPKRFQENLYDHNRSPKYDQGSQRQKFKRLTHSNSDRNITTKWTTVDKSSPKAELMATRRKEEDTRNGSMFEDIVNRISNLKQPKSHGSELTKARTAGVPKLDEDKGWNCVGVPNEDASQNDSFEEKNASIKKPSRYRTVAPKLLTTNTTPVDYNFSSHAASARARRVGSSYSFSDDFSQPSISKSGMAPNYYNNNNNNGYEGSGNRRHRRREDSFNCEWSGQSEASSSLSNYYTVQPTPIGTKLASMQSSSYVSSHSMRHPGNRYAYQSPMNESFGGPAATRYRGNPLYYQNVPYEGYYMHEPPVAPHNYDDYGRGGGGGNRNRHVSASVQMSPGSSKWQSPPGYFAKHSRFNARPSTDEFFRNRKFFR